MNLLQELRLHAEALKTAVEQDPKFFAAVNHYASRLREITASPGSETSQAELALIGEKLERFWSQYRPRGDGLYIPPAQASRSDSTVSDIYALTRRIKAMPEADFAASLASLGGSQPGGGRGDAIFVGHGRSRLWSRVQVFLQDELGLRVVAYESESRVGESIVPVLEKMLGEARFAAMVLTAEDETAAGGRRARQNVIHEAGLFQGRLGFKRAVLLIQEGLEDFTNIAGLQHIRFSADAIEQTFYELQRVLKREGLVK